MSQSQDGPAVEAIGLTRRFGARDAVRDLDLAVPAGCFFGFLGPNGAGKSTTIRMLTGLLPATRGEARILGHVVAPGRVEFKRHVGVVPEDLALFDRLSALEHLVLAGRLHGLSTDEARGRARDLLELLELSDAQHVHAVDASGGTRKKVALGMALIHAPRVLFLDEPFTGLDPVASRSLKRLLERLAARGVTIFMTSHVLEVVERLCQRVAIIVEGSKVLDEDVVEITRSGASLEERFTALAGRPPVEREIPWLA